MTGWGSWTGYGTVQKKKDETAERKKKIEKQKRIKEILRNRKDGKHNKIIMNEKRQKYLKKYLVNELPHGYTTKKQFDYEITKPVGTEWNTQELYQNNIKKNVVTKDGQIIKPLNRKRLPKTKYI